MSVCVLCLAGGLRRSAGVSQAAGQVPRVRGRREQLQHGAGGLRQQRPPSGVQRRAADSRRGHQHRRQGDAGHQQLLG